MIFVADVAHIRKGNYVCEMLGCGGVGRLFLHYFCNFVYVFCDAAQTAVLLGFRRFGLRKRFPVGLLRRMPPPRNKGNNYHFAITQLTPVPVVLAGLWGLTRVGCRGLRWGGVSDGIMNICCVQCNKNTSNFSEETNIAGLLLGSSGRCVKRLWGKES